VVFTKTKWQRLGGKFLMIAIYLGYRMAYLSEFF
jgi:hypothetical protein